MKTISIAVLVAAPLLLGACGEVRKTTVVAPEGTTVSTTPGATVTTVDGTVKTPATVTVTPPAVSVTDTCGAASYQALIGQSNPAITVPAGTAYRQYRTGEPITMDMNPARVNFEYNRSRTLIKVTCG